jgi:ribosomal protein L30
MKNLINKDIIVEQTRSYSGLTKIQKANLNGLGLRGIGSKSSLLCTDSVFGMINKVKHLIKVYN